MNLHICKLHPNAITFHVVEQLSITERGAGGFGSTGEA